MWQLVVAWCELVHSPALQIREEGLGCVGDFVSSVHGLGVSHRSGLVPRRPLKHGIAQPLGLEL